MYRQTCAHIEITWPDKQSHLSVFSHMYSQVAIRFVHICLEVHKYKKKQAHRMHIHTQIDGDIHIYIHRGINTYSRDG